MSYFDVQALLRRPAIQPPTTVATPKRARVIWPGLRLTIVLTGLHSNINRRLEQRPWSMKPRALPHINQ